MTSQFIEVQNAEMVFTSRKGRFHALRRGWQWGRAARGGAGRCLRRHLGRRAKKQAHPSERGVWGHGMADLLIKRIRWP